MEDNNNNGPLRLRVEIDIACASPSWVIRDPIQHVNIPFQRAAAVNI